MADPLAARAQQLRNIEAKTGQSFAQLCALITSNDRAKLGKQRQMQFQTLDLTYRDANPLALMAKNAAQTQARQYRPAGRDLYRRQGGIAATARSTNGGHCRTGRR